MSAYIVDPRTIDYLVAAVHRRRHGDHGTTQTDRLWQTMEDVPKEYRHAIHGGEQYGYRFDLNQISKNDLGQILMRENVRSVSWRYGDEGHRAYWGEGHGMDAVAPDDLPGPVDQTRVWAYRFRPVPNRIDWTWVLSCARCLRYQSCETPDYDETLAAYVLRAIEAKAVDELTDDAPWGVTEADLERSLTA